MPTEPDYRELLEKAQQCTEEVNEFLVAVCNSPQGQSSDVILTAAALTVEQLRMVEEQISRIWELFQQRGRATYAPTLSDTAPPVQPDEEPDRSAPSSWSD
jgi:hypothetical protein